LPLQQLRMSLCDEDDEIALEKHPEISAAPTSARGNGTRSFEVA
jgi:hypothetical protein